MSAPEELHVYRINEKENIDRNI